MGDKKMDNLRKHFLDVASPSSSNRHTNQIINSPSTAIETHSFLISFETNKNNETNVKFPNGKTVSSHKKEVNKNLIRAVIKACLDNNMKKKAKLLRSSIKDDGIF